MRDRPDFLSKVIALFLMAVGAVWAAAAAAAQSSDAEAPRPKGHFKIEQAKNVTPEEAATIYRDIIDDLAEGYAHSADSVVDNYRTWRRYNTAPYLSAPHGSRYVNNYANGKAKGYGEGEVMPPGAIFAKDSFTVAADGGVFGGALFIMEKLPPAANPETADWRYAIILLDGSLFGDSQGDGQENVVFCHTCHVRVARNDHLFFVPREFRLAP